MTIAAPTFYGTLVEAEVYFSQRLNTTQWDLALVNDRTAALSMATRAIDRLNFAGDKADEDQELQFPRDDDTEVPEAIRIAAYECALRYVDGVDLDHEARDIGVLANSTSAGTRTTFQEGTVAEHLRAGISSAEAWYYLLPFLRNPHDLTFSRVS